MSSQLNEYRINAMNDKQFFWYLRLGMYFRKGSLLRNTKSLMRRAKIPKKNSVTDYKDKLTNYLNSERSWWLFILLMLTMYFVLPLVEVSALDILPSKRSFFSYVNNNRVSHVIGLLGILFTIVGIALSNLARKNSYVFRSLVRKAYVYPAFYTIAANIICMALLYIFTDLISIFVDIERVSVTANYIFVFTMVTTAVCFAKILRFVDEDSLYLFITGEAIDSTKKRIIDSQIRIISSKRYEELVVESGTGFYDYLTSKKLCNSSYISYESITGNDAHCHYINKYIVNDVSIKRLMWLLKRVNDRYPGKLLVTPLSLINEEYNTNIAYTDKNLPHSSQILKLIGRCFSIRRVSKLTKRQNCMEYLTLDLLDRARTKDEARVSQILDVFYLIYDVYYQVRIQGVSVTLLFSDTEKAVFDALYIALENIDNSVFSSILSHSLRNQFKALDADDLSAILETFHCLRRVYLSSLTLSKSNSNYDGLKDHTSRRIAMNLRDLISLIGIRFNSEHNVKTNSDLLPFYERVFEMFARFAYDHIMNLDWNNLDYVLNALGEASPSYATGYRSIEEDIWEGLPKSDNAERKNDIIEFNAIKRRPVELWMNSILGLRYWGVLLYERSCNEQSEKLIAFEAECVLKLWKITCIDDSFPLLNNIENLLTVLCDRGYLGMDRWDYIVRMSGKTYTPPSPDRWFLLGFVIDLIKSNNDYMLDSTNINNRLIDLLISLRGFISSAKNAYDLWGPIVLLTKDEFPERCERFISLINHKVSMHKVEMARLVASKPLSKDKVDAIVTRTNETWDSSAFINALCKQSNCVEVVTSSFPHSSRFGNRLYYRNLKQLLIDDPVHDLPFNSDEFGRTFCQYEEQLFYESVSKCKDRIRSESSVVQAIANGLSYLQNHCSPTVIIMHSRLLNMAELFNNPDFIPKWRVQDRLNEKISYSMFKDVKVFMTYRSAFMGMILICDFQKAFQILKSDRYHDGSVYLGFEELTAIEVEENLSKEPEKWMIDEYGITLTKDQAHYRIKNGIYVDIWLYKEFIIHDKDSLLLYKIKTDHIEV